MERRTPGSARGGDIGEVYIGDVFAQALNRPEGVTDGVPNAELNTFVSLYASWFRQLAARGEGQNSVLHQIPGVFRDYEHRFPDTTIWDRARVNTAGRLLDAAHPQTSAELIVGMHDMRRAGEAVAFMVQSGDSLLGPIQSRLVLREFDRADDVRGTLFRRHLRNAMLAMDPEVHNHVILDGLEKDLAHDPNYDPVQDWAEIGAETIPEGRWEEIAAYVAESSLWGGEVVTLRFRQNVGTALALRQRDFARSGSLTGKGFHAMKGIVGDSEESEYPILDMMKFTLTMSLFEHGHLNRGRALARNIGRPVVMGHVVDALLREDQPDEARRLVTDIPDANVVVGMLLGAPWPDQAIPAGLFKELIEMDKKHNPTLRVGVMRSLGDIYEEQGRPDDARYIRGRADLVELQVARGILKFKEPKR